ncbi:hypothetical protein BAUCODRAFT_34820, partial [Baudoinia panamericana UAMH 10762]
MGIELHASIPPRTASRGTRIIGGQQYVVEKCAVPTTASMLLCLAANQNPQCDGTALCNFRSHYLWCNGEHVPLYRVLACGHTRRIKAAEVRSCIATASTSKTFRLRL